MKALFIVLLIVAVVATSALAKGYGCEKKVAFDRRLDCHPDAGATEAVCRQRGCVWCADVDSGKGIPWCFHANARKLGYGCEADVSDWKKREDCHPEPNANEDTCRSRDCVWCANVPSGKGIPWCFKKA